MMDIEPIRTVAITVKLISQIAEVAYGLLGGLLLLSEILLFASKNVTSALCCFNPEWYEQGVQLSD